MKKIKQTVEAVSATLRLQPNKQRTVLSMLHQHSRLEWIELAALMSLSMDHLEQVVRGKAYFNAKEAKRLAEYFCIFCGE